MNKSTSIAYIDFLAVLLVFFMMCTGILITQIKQIESNGNLTQKAEIVATIDWPDNSPNDVDLWMKSPDGSILWYKNRSAGVMTLDQDERGNNAMVPYRQEVASIRGSLPGIYIVQVTLFEKRGTDPVNVNATLTKLNPVYSNVTKKTVTLEKMGDTVVLFKFSVDAAGVITVLNSSQEDKF